MMAAAIPNPEDPANMQPCDGCANCIIIEYDDYEQEYRAKCKVYDGWQMTGTDCTYWEKEEG